MASKSKSTMGSPNLVEGFNVMPVKFSENSKCEHSLFFKEHRVRGTHESKPQERTLFVVNVPPFCDEECLQHVFGRALEGESVQHVWLHAKPTSGAPALNDSDFFPTFAPVRGFKVAYVVFKKATAVQKAMQLTFEEPLVLQAASSAGVKKWRQEYNSSIPDVRRMKAEIDDYMRVYDEKVEEEKRKAKEMDGVPDEEGWITVTRHGKKPVIPRSEESDKRILENEKKKRSKKELVNFYTFQIRESKMEHLAQLRKKFEEDKQRIAIMKASRKFKPY